MCLDARLYTGTEAITACVRACICVRARVYTHMPIHTCLCTHVYAHMSTRVYPHMSKHTHVHTPLPPSSRSRSCRSSCRRGGRKRRRCWHRAANSRPHTTPCTYTRLYILVIDPALRPYILVIGPTLRLYILVIDLTSSVHFSHRSDTSSVHFSHRSDTLSKCYIEPRTSGRTRLPAGTCMPVDMCV